MHLQVEFNVLFQGLLDLLTQFLAHGQVVAALIHVYLVVLSEQSKHFQEVDLLHPGLVHLHFASNQVELFQNQAFLQQVSHHQEIPVHLFFASSHRYLALNVLP